ncbi:MAG: hypothetical protein R3C18_24100 [Planctomycetaceae bacterium]
MAEGLDLPQLHSLLRQLHGVQDELASGPRQIKIREKRIAAAEQLVVERSRDLTQTRADADSKNLDLKTKEQDLHKLRGKLNAAATNREYEILQGQIEADTVAKSVLEDEIIEFLERAELIQQEIAQAKEAVVQLKEQLQKFTAEFEAKLPGLESRKAELEKQLAEAEKPLPGNIKDHYQRIRVAHGADALACADTGSCSECFVTITTQNKVLLNSGNALLCPSCGRLLYVTGKK